MAAYIAQVYQYFGSCESEAKPTKKLEIAADPKADAEALRKAMKGFGTDELAIINVLCRRPNWVRQQILREYTTLFGRDLIADLKSELGGHFEDIMVAIMLPRFEFEAKELRKAMKGVGTDEKTIIDIVCTKGNEELAQLISAYTDVHGRDLIEDIKNDTSRDFERLMVALLQTNREQSYNVDVSRAKADAQRLYEAGEKKWGTDEAVFLSILGSESFAQLRQLFKEYGNLAGHDIVDAIKGELRGSYEKALVALVYSVRSTPAYFAYRIHRAMKGAGTDDQVLIRTVVSRSEVDMVQIKNEYEKMFEISLEDAINNETSGDYKKALLVLIGED